MVTPQITGRERERSAIELPNHRATFATGPETSGRAGDLAREGHDYFATLDGWRALAVLTVMFGHLSVGVGLGQFREIGGLGVQVFFGMSGFLITTLLLSEERKTGSISLNRFYLRRAFRILPAATVFLAVVGVLALASAIPLSFARWLSTLLFAANYSPAPASWYVGHFWSLAVEEHFYFLWPALLCFVPSSRKRLTFALAVAFAIGIWRAVDFHWKLTWIDTAHFVGRTDINADAILFGAVAALALADARISPFVRRVVGHRLAAYVAVEAFVLTIVLQPVPVLAFPLMTIRAIVVPVMILATVHRPDTRLGRLLEAKPLRFIGLISYSLYLWQQLFLSWQPSSALAAVQWFPFNVAAAFACACASFYLVERPMIRLGRSPVFHGMGLRSLPA